MKLRGIDFGNVLNSSGARGFFGEGYWFHDFWRRFGLDYTGSTFVAKTTTLHARDGNMKLASGKDWPKPIKKLPDCIVVKPFQGVVLNAVGLSGPGAANLIPKWIRMDADPKQKPFMVSFMSTADTALGRIADLTGFILLMKIVEWSKIALQLNFSCPNVGLDPTILVSEIKLATSIAAELNVPLLVKVNALVPPMTAIDISQIPHVDAIVCSNTIPWGKMPEYINWAKIFGTHTSPLAKYGGGGLSGAPLHSIVKDWVERVWTFGCTKPIVAGGGILTPDDAIDLIHAGADAVELGSVSILRPWRVAKIIKQVNEVITNADYYP